MKKVQEYELQKGKVYFFSNLREAKGVYEGVDADDALIFTPKVLGNYYANSKGFVNFSKDPSSDWIESN